MKINPLVFSIPGILLSIIGLVMAIIIDINFWIIGFSITLGYFLRSLIWNSTSHNAPKEKSNE